MTPSPRSLFVEGRTRAKQERTHQQELAVRTVAGNAHDRTDFAYLLSVLGLDQPEPLGRRLAVYVHQVAAATGVPAEAATYEVTDTATARIGLGRRCDAEPDHDLTLMWNERLGWYLAVEATSPGTPLVMAYLDGDAVPGPAAVARFVDDATGGGRVSRIRPVQPLVDRTALAEKMATVC